MTQNRDKLETTKEFVDFVKKTKSYKTTKAIVDSSRAQCLKLFSKLGITRKTVDRKKRIYDYEHNPAICSIHTAKTVLKHIKSGVATANILNHTYAKKIDKLAVLLLKSQTTQTHKPLIKILRNSKNIIEIRDAVKQLKRVIKDRKSLLNKLNNLKIEHCVYYMLNDALNEISTTVNKKSEVVLRKKHDNRIRLNPNFIISKAHEVLVQDKPNINELIASLIVVSGRRPTEIIKTACFEKLKENLVAFSGQLKTKTRVDTACLNIEIPLITNTECTVDVIIEKTKYVQRKLRNKKISYPDASGTTVTKKVGLTELRYDIAHNRGLNWAYNKNINYVFNAWLGITGVTAKSMRAMYSAVCYEKYAHKGISQSAYSANVLGYRKDSFSATRNYEQIEVDYDIETVKKPTKELDKKSTQFIEFLKKSTEKIKSNTRSPNIPILHKLVIQIAEDGNISSETMTAGRLANIGINGKRLNINTAKKYIEILDTLKSDTEE